MTLLVVAVAAAFAVLAVLAVKVVRLERWRELHDGTPHTRPLDDDAEDTDGPTGDVPPAGDDLRRYREYMRAGMGLDGAGPSNVRRLDGQAG